MSQRSTRLRGFFAVLLFFYWTALFVGTHIPLRIQGSHTHDKSMHIAAYAGLAFLFTMVVAATRPRLSLLLAAFLVIAVYGAADELTQLLIPGRTGDLQDWLADLLGASLGLVVYLLVIAGLQVTLWARAAVLRTTEA